MGAHIALIDDMANVGICEQELVGIVTVSRGITLQLHRKIKDSRHFGLSQYNEWD